MYENHAFTRETLPNIKINAAIDTLQLYKEGDELQESQGTDECKRYEKADEGLGTYDDPMRKTNVLQMNNASVSASEQGNYSDITVVYFSMGNTVEVTLGQPGETLEIAQAERERTFESYAFSTKLQGKSMKYLKELKTFKSATQNGPFSDNINNLVQGAIKIKFIAQLPDGNQAITILKIYNASTPPIIIRIPHDTDFLFFDVLDTTDGASTISGTSSSSDITSIGLIIIARRFYKKVRLMGFDVPLFKGCKNIAYYIFQNVNTVNTPVYTPLQYSSSHKQIRVNRDQYHVMTPFLFKRAYQLNAILTTSDTSATQSSPSEGGTAQYLTILGRRRKIVMKGRTQYVMYQKELIKLSDAKKIENKKKKDNKDKNKDKITKGLA